MSARHPRPTHSQLVARGRGFERADVIGQLRQSIAGAREIEAKHRGSGTEPGIDTTLYVARLEALIGTLQAGCHEGLGADAGGGAGGGAGGKAGL